MRTDICEASKARGETVPFHVPDQFLELADEVQQRFSQLIAKGVITGISPIQFEGWLSNFHTDEERYLAARLLENLTYRSESMVKSSMDDLLQCVLPSELQKIEGLFPYMDLDEFLDSLEEGAESHSLRFVAVDGSHERQPGKSGAVIIREFQRHARVNKRLTCRPEHLGELPDHVKTLVFIDDMVGTGRQFRTFAKHYQLDRMAERRVLIYCPLIAYQDGVSRLQRALPWLFVHPVEMFGTPHRFFRSTDSQSEVWAIDRVNCVVDVKAFLAELSLRNQIPSTTSYCLDLLLGFQHATPNNTLPIMYASSATWKNLLLR